MNTIFLSINLTLNLNKEYNPLDNMFMCICNHYEGSHNIFTNKCDYEHCGCLQFNNKNIILNIDKGIKKSSYWKIIEQEVNLRGLLNL